MPATDERVYLSTENKARLTALKTLEGFGSVDETVGHLFNEADLCVEVKCEDTDASQKD